MERGRVLGLALGGLLAVQAGSAFAGGEVHEEAKSGVRTLIRTIWNCVGAYPWGDQGAHVDHGSVTVVKTTRRSCGEFAAPVPANEIWYTSPPGFKGVDRVIYWGRLASAPPFIIDVDVK